jgi:hypothetical protein
MSSNLAWFPVVVPKGHDLSDELKFVLRKRYGEPVKALMTGKDVPYLLGLLDADIKDVCKLIDAIGKFGEIDVREVF